jgi:hypothetical protein
MYEREININYNVFKKDRTLAEINAHEANVEVRWGVGMDNSSLRPHPNV